MSERARRPAIYNDLSDLPDNQVGEIIAGELHVHPRPSPKHAMSASSLGDELVGPFQKGRGGPGGWLILDEPECKLGDDILVPNLAGWKRERLGGPPDTNYIAVVPDWVCEILSPGTMGIDRIRKMPIYGVYQVRYIWLIDPQQKTLEAFKLQDNRWVLIAAHGELERVHVEPFHEIALELGALWWEAEGDEAG